MLAGRRSTGITAKDASIALRVGIGLALVSVAAVVASCGGESKEKGFGVDSMNQQVLTLPYDVSLDEVKAELGAPQSEFESGDEATLSYLPSWRLIFVDESLKEKKRERRPRGQRLAGRALNQKVVFDLKRGATVDAVEVSLGSPDAVEDVYRADQEPSLVLWYGSWELRFQAGRLVHRTSY